MDKNLNEMDSMRLSSLNKKIDIYQIPEEFSTRTSQNVAFLHSEEKKLIENEAAIILQNVNSLLYFSTFTEGKYNVNHSEFELRKAFRESINKDVIEQTKVDDYCFMKLKEIYEKSEEYKVIKRLIDLQRFDQEMRTNREFLIFILKHPLLKYHPRYKEICDKYTSLLSNHSN